MPICLQAGLQTCPAERRRSLDQKDGHLPGIPSEAEAKAHGIDLASMQVKLPARKSRSSRSIRSRQQKLLEGQNRRIEQLEKENTELRTQH